LETVSVTGTVAVVVPAASAPVKGKTPAQGRGKTPGSFSFHKACLSAAGAPPQWGPPAAVLWFIRLLLGFSLYAAVSHSTMNTTFATVAPSRRRTAGDDGGVVDLRRCCRCCHPRRSCSSPRGRVDECLGVGVGGVGGLLLPAADGDGKPSLLLSTFSRRDGLIAEGRELPTGAAVMETDFTRTAP
jgi:hypothetical protein